MDKAGSERLNLNTAIEGRDSLNSTLIAAGAALQTLSHEDCTGYEGVGDCANSNGNKYCVMTAGYKIRDYAFDTVAQKVNDIGEIFDFVVIGGVAAAEFQWEFPGIHDRKSDGRHFREQRKPAHSSTEHASASGLDIGPVQFANHHTGLRRQFLLTSHLTRLTGCIAILIS